MKKKRTLTCALVLAAGLLITPTLASCNNTPSSSEQVAEKTVTFKVQDDNGEWKNLGNPLTITDGKISSIPTAPSKSYYTFRGWFLDKNWVTEFTNENLTESIEVYAYYVKDEVNIYINGESQGTRALVDVVNGTYNPGEGLTFDGWYTDEACQVKYKEGDSAKTLYAQSVATITFDNGYETVYKTSVKPNATLSDPSKTKVTVDGNETTLEQSEIVKSYMSSEDIYYVDENGNDIDFSKAITKNTTIKVMWKSPFLKYQYGDNTTGDKVLMCLGTYGKFSSSDKNKAKVNAVPVISFPSRVTFAETDDGEKTLHEVKMAYVFDQAIFSSTALKKVIVQEGIKVIRGFSSVSGTSSVESFSLPNSLKIIQNSFNNLNLTSTSVTIPNGVEAIYASFFKGGSVNYNNEATTFYTGTNYDFDINVPSSVKSLSIVPTNLKFASDSSFVNDGTMIYQNTSKGKVLVSYTEMEDGIIKVPEGIEGIQVGTFVNLSSLRKLVLPKSFKFVNYNLNYDDYKDCYTWVNSTYANIECYLYDENNTADMNGEIAYNAKLICEKLESMNYLVFLGDVDSSLYKAFGGNATQYAYYYGNFTSSDDEVYKDIKTVNIKETATPKVNITLTNALSSSSYNVSLNRTSQTPITYEEIFEAIDTKYETTLKDDYTAKNIKVSSVNNLLEAYDITSEIKTDLYLDVIIDYTATSAGVNIDTTGDNAVVTSFNESSAINLGNDTYAVIIPSEVDGKKVIEIKENAFASQGRIKFVKMGENITTIGENAFLGDLGLTNIDFNNAKLVSIGKSAFEDTSLTSVSFSISSLKELGNCAFKIETLKEFIPVNDEEASRNVTSVKDGEFYFVPYLAVNDSQTALVTKYLMLNQKVSSSLNEETNITTYEVKMYAYASKATVSDGILLGENHEDENYIVRYEVMEGSINSLTLDSSNYIVLNYVSKIHKGAISDTTVGTYGFQYNAEGLGLEGAVSKLQNLVEAAPDIFEDEWISNYESIKTTFIGAY